MWSRPQQMMLLPVQRSVRHALRPAFAVAPRFHGISHRMALARQASSSSTPKYPDPLDEPSKDDDDGLEGWEPTNADLLEVAEDLKQTYANQEAALKSLEEDAKQPGVIEKFGWYPTIGLGLTALIGKEMLILSPAALLGTYSFVAMGLAWLLAGETMQKASVAAWEEEKRQQEDFMGACIELVKAEIAGWKTKGVEARLLEQYRVESEAINEKWVSAQILKARHALRADMQLRLADIFNREQNEMAQAQAKLVNDSIAFVRQKFAKRDPKTDQETFEFALLGIGTEGKLPKEQDPVRKAFLEFFKSRGITPKT